MKRALIAGIAGSAMILSLAGCAGGSGSDSGSGSGDGGLVGVAMPTKSSERWIADGNNVKSQLEEAGYQVDLQYAEDDIPTQVSQLENMITKGAKALIIASIDGTTLTSVLEEAAANDIPVIAYDRLIRDSANVDYYATFDNYKVGVQQATSLLAGLGLTDLEGTKATDAPAGPFNIELFAGSPDDNNATFFFNGAMDTLQPYIDDKTLVVASGETEFNTVATLRWDPEVAQSRMEDIITKTYSDGTKIQGVLSPYDGLSRGIISALTDAGYTVGTDFPIITGQDAELDSVKAIISGEQYATIYKDTRELAKEAVSMAQAVLEGTEPEVNDTETYDNGEKVVPSFLLEPVIVTKDEIQSVLVDGGYYTDEEVNG
ncbi:substrate-binding domain-containing protein [Rathayibacter sp. VKM Ac-2803]|uniref:multiple monosaccharide ABC transporter substrate-binding protein n=1 Tax=unclassified Rathayibacter TaxID=2609250 RepID=UPI00135A8C8E|nr:multiple monosaccharide ABC transporter substrate-binding protein [Rathayibacter sp. VKM Ac-2754]MWV49184.1 substrate-binding domain-containing protein [Rathayibacter sp. VKM Ac-2803]MWV58324.1 substrate-binding domain-containing protein [Rathayibacter sp. VKM Ac-2754]